MRPTRVIRSVWLFPDPFVPVITVSIERSGAMAVYTDIVAAKDEGCGLVLVTDG